jgi:GNAT superfamily N-acetyltransferase
MPTASAARLPLPDRIPALPMEITARTGNGDLRQVAGLHVESLPTSLPAVLGRGFVEEFYRQVRASRSNILLVAKSETGVQGFCHVCLDDAALKRRLLLRTSLTLRLIRHLGDKSVRALIRSQFRPDAGAAKAGIGLPELLYIAAAPAARGTGIGGALVAAVDSALRTAGYDSYRVCTEDRRGNRAVDFYLAHGFGPAGTMTRNGTRFLVFAKRL